MPSLENDETKVVWDVPQIVDRRPDNNAIKPDMIYTDKVNKRIIFIEGTVCTVGFIEQRRKDKQEKYTQLRKSFKRIYKDHQVSQVNIVFDFLANYEKNLELELKTILVIRKTQKKPCHKSVSKMDTLQKL